MDKSGAFEIRSMIMLQHLPVIHDFVSVSWSRNTVNNHDTLFWLECIWQQGMGYHDDVNVTTNYQ